MKRFVGYILLLLSLVAPVLAEASFPEVVEALQAKDDNLAISLIQELEAEQPSFGLYYNKGLALRYQRRFAQSRAAFEKALTYDPRDISTRRRLREVKEQLSPDLMELDATGTPVYTRSEAQLLLLLPTLLMIGLAVARIIGRPVSRRQAVVCLGFYLAIAGLLWWNNPADKRAVLISPSAKVLKKPAADSSGLVVPNGVLVEVLGEQSHFVEVRTGDGKRGWLRAAELERI